MEFYKKIIILLTLIIFSYLLYKLIKRRGKLQAISEKPTNIEEFDNYEAGGEVSASKDTENNSGIANIIQSEGDMAIKEYVIKSSYNSAVSGKYVSLEMLKYVISRGCRFLDFEIHSFDEEPYVCYTNEVIPTNIDSANKIKFEEILSCVRANSFMDPAPNPEDPLFIHLRIKSNTKETYDNVAKIIDKTIGDKLNTCDVTPNTKLWNLRGKIVLIIDKTSSPDYKNYSNCKLNDTTCKDLIGFINLESGGDHLRIYKYSTLLNLAIMPPYIFEDGTSDVNALRLAIPDIGTNVVNPSAYEFIADYGVQFRDNKVAFVKIGKLLPYLNNLRDNDEI